MIRLRGPKAKPGELKIQWGKLPGRGETPELIYVWGDGCSKQDSHLMHNAMAAKQPDPFVKPIFSRMNPSFVEELEARGYDLTTLRFYIRKKQQEPTK